jgi:type IV secretion system protein VirD4
VSTPAVEPGSGWLTTVVLLVVGVSVTVWLGAAAAAAVSGGGVLPATLADAMVAAVRLPSHVSRPADAWPVAAATVLPGPVVYWAATTVAAPFVAVPAGLLLRWWTGGPVGTARRTPLGVDARPRFARPRDLAPLIVRRPLPGRFALGRVGRRLVATEGRATSRWRRQRRRGDRGAVALIGPSRSGKTAAAVAGILEWPGPAVLASVKTDLWAPTAGWRSRLGTCRVFDPTGYTGHPGAGWTPLRAADSASGAQRAARALCDAAPRHGVEGGADFWLAQAEILLSGLLWLARHHDRPMGDVVEWVMTQEGPTEAGTGTVERLVDEALATGEVDAFRAARCLFAVWGMDDRTRGSVYATTQTVIWPWADPGVAAAALRQDIDLDWLLSGPNTLYLCAPIGEQRRLTPAFGGLLNDLIAQVYLRAAATGGPVDPPLLVVLDEAGNTPLRALPEYASTLAGVGVLLVTAWQSVAQLEAAYGRAADTILTNHLTKVLFAGLSDLASLTYASRLLGEVEVDTRSESGALHTWTASESVSTTRVGMVPPHVLRQMRPGHALLVHGTLPPAHLRPRAYYREPTLRCRAGLSPSGAGR